MTTLTLTPQPATASVLLEVAGAPLEGAAIASWAFTTTVEGWTPVGTGTIVDWYPDDAALELAAWPGGAAASPSIAVTPGQRYRVSGKVRGALGLVDVALAVGESTGETVTASTTFYKDVTHEFIPSTSTVQVELVRVGGTGQQIVYLDDVTVAPVPDPPTLTRTDANGTAPVRLREGQQPIAGVMTATDYEAALTGLVRYDLTDGDGVTVTASTELAVAVPWLGVPVLPQLGEQLEFVTDYRHERASAGTVHEVLDADAPVPALAPLGTRAGQLVLTAQDFPTALAVQAVYDAGQVAHLRQADHPGMDLYHVAESVSVAPERSRWAVTVRFREVPAPLAPLQGGLGTTYAQLAGQTYATTRQQYPTYLDRSTRDGS